MLIVGGSLFFASQQEPTRATSARDAGPTSVVDVNSSSARGAADAWNATSLRALPGEVLILPPATATACEPTVAAAARAGTAITATVECAAGDTMRVTASGQSLRQGVAAISGREGSLVLLGDGWTMKPPVPIDVEKLGDPRAVANAIKDASLAGAIPDMTGIDVVVAGPAPTPEVRRIWDAYFSAARTASVEWAVVSAQRQRGAARWLRPQVTVATSGAAAGKNRQ